MWRVILVCLLAWTSGALLAEEITVTTWNLKWFPSGLANKKNPEKEDSRIAEVANVLRKLDSDIILLQEVRDEESANRLLERIAPGRYHLAIVSRFRDNGTVGWQQLIIAAKLPARVAYAQSWKTFGTTDPPRGFAFATFEMKGLSLAVYTVHLKSNLVRGDAVRQTQLNILKRELAAQQLVAHVDGLPVAGLMADMVIVGGDFNTSPDDKKFISEATLGTFEKAGFSNPILLLPAVNRITIPGEGRYPPATFDYLLTKGGPAGLVVSIEPSEVSDHRPVTIRIPVKTDH